MSSEAKEEVARLRPINLGRVVFGLALSGLVFQVPWILPFVAVQVLFAVGWVLLLETGLLIEKDHPWSALIPATMDHSFVFLVSLVTGNISSFLAVAYIGLVLITATLPHRWLMFYAIALASVLFLTSGLLTFYRIIPGVNMLTGESAIPTPLSLLFSSALFFLFAAIGARTVRAMFFDVETQKSLAQQARSDAEAAQHDLTLQLRESELLADLARSANEGRDLGDVIAALHLAMRERMEQTMIGLFLMDPGGETMGLRLAAADGLQVEKETLPPAIKSIELKDSRGAFARAVKMQKLVQLPSARLIKNGNPADRALYEFWKYSWMILLPLRLRGQVIGILVLLTRQEAPVNRRDRSFLVRLSDQVAGIIRTTEELAEKQKMATIGDMAAGIVHDLKNPVALIKGSVELADDDSINREERRELLSIVDQEADRMLLLVQDLLDFSRGAVSIQKRQVKLSDYVSRLEKSISPMFRAKQISLSVRSEDGGLASLDPDRFMRVLINISANAAEALPEKGEFRIAVVRQPNQIQFTLDDNGPGIPESIRGRLFEPFVTQGKKSGTGLGMAIAKSVVDAHGGAISFRTETGRGTTFTIELPL